MLSTNILRSRFMFFFFLPDKFIYNTLRKFPRIINLRSSKPVNTEAILPVNTNQVFESFFNRF
jgi:hypothetical protein